MTEQLAIDFSAPRARRSDPATSHDAAASVDVFSAEHYQRIIRALKSGGPGTIYEIAERCGMTHVQVARRLPEMQGRLVRIRASITRRGPTGRACRVWDIA
jgi:predicted ArsR family transcriptional regulator